MCLRVKLIIETKKLNLKAVLEELGGKERGNEHRYKIKRYCR